MTPRREVYEQENNEIEQQYAQHNLDKDMAAAYRASLSNDPQQYATKLKAENRGIILILIVLLGGLGLYVWLS